MINDSKALMKISPLAIKRFVHDSGIDTTVEGQKMVFSNRKAYYELASVDIFVLTSERKVAKSR